METASVNHRPLSIKHFKRKPRTTVNLTIPPDLLNGVDKFGANSGDTQSKRICHYVILGLEKEGYVVEKTLNFEVKKRD